MRPRQQWPILKGNMIMNAPSVERNPHTGRWQRVSPAFLAAQAKARQDARKTAVLEDRRVAARKRGYTGPLTRADLSARVSG